MWYKIIVLVIDLIVFFEILQLIYYKFYIYIEEFNAKIKKRIDSYDQRMTIFTNDLNNGDATIHDFNIRVKIPTRINFRYINYLEKQILMDWVDQAVYIRKMLFKSKMRRAVFLKTIIKQLGNKNGI